MFPIDCSGHKFHMEQVLQQSFLLSHLLLILAIEGFWPGMINHAATCGWIQAIDVLELDETTTHLQRHDSHHRKVVQFNLFYLLVASHLLNALQPQSQQVQA